MPDTRPRVVNNAAGTRESGAQGQDALLLRSKDLFPLVQELLESGRQARITVTGGSMWPLIRSRRDSVLLEKPRVPPRAGDVVLTLQAAPGRYLLHRVVRVREGQCVTMGDSAVWQDAPVPLASVVARAVTLYRGRRAIRLDGLPARAYALAWRILTPLRAPLLRLLRRMARRRARKRKQA